MQSSRAQGGSGGKVFGRPLEHLLEEDRRKRPYLQVPLFIKKATTYLIAHGNQIPVSLQTFACLIVFFFWGGIANTKGLAFPGIFKAAGSGPEVAHYQHAIDGPDSQVINFDKVEDVNTVSSLLKTFLKRLPEPLFTAHLYPLWLQAPRNPPSQNKHFVWMLPYSYTRWPCFYVA